jgi:putative PIN family toxin of toxin-antitoxin system
MAAKKHRIILDTNLWISFLLSKEFSKLDKLLLHGKAKLLFSEELIEEFLSVVTRPKLKKYFTHSDVQNLLATIYEIAEFIDVKSDIAI